MLHNASFRPLLLLSMVVLAAYAVLAVSAGQPHDASYGAIEGCNIPAGPSAASGGLPLNPDFQAFEMVEPAERYVCHYVPIARELHGWQFSGIDAMRLNAVFNGKHVELWSLNFRYTLGTYSTPSARYMTIFETGGNAFFNDPRRPFAHPEGGVLTFDKPPTILPYSVGPQPAQFVVRENSPPSVVWSVGGVTIAAMFPGDDSGSQLTMVDVLPLLQAVR